MNFCKDCGKEISKQAKRCRSCDTTKRNLENNPMWNPKVRKKLKETIKRTKGNTGKNNPRWKGENCNIDNKHKFVRKNKPYNGYCECCLCEIPFDEIELANIKNHIYTKNIEDYKYFCKKCHGLYDRAGIAFHVKSWKISSVFGSFVISNLKEQCRKMFVNPQSAYISFLTFGKYNIFSVERI